jgi:TolB-like protein/DNA-binding winged helix-turn-helix (wHTH) protein/Tfp pilus assembly protein PilF
LGSQLCDRAKSLRIAEPYGTQCSDELRVGTKMNANQSGAFAGHSEIFQVGDLLIDVGQQSVRRAGQEIPLPNLSFKLLLTLVRAAPNFVSNEMLMQLVWPGIVVSPETVSKRAALLRDALGDDSREPRYIAGLRSRGYRIIIPVSTEPPADAKVPPPSEPPSAVRPMEPAIASSTGTSKRRQLRVAVGLGAILLVAVAVLIASLRHSVGLGQEESGRTVAVLPFDNVSSNAADAYLAVGIPEMLLNRMAGVHALRVIARGSSFAIATKGVEPRDIGDRLGSAYLIEGSVQREDDRLRIAVELIETATNRLLWSERFDRGVGDILHLEDDIGDQLTNVLLGRLGGLRATPVVKKRSENIEAYLAFLRGRTLLGRFTITDSDAAVAEFQKAIDLDPKFAPAYASLYDARMQAAASRYQDLAPLRVEYRPLIDRALLIDPNSGAAYFARAMWAEGSSASKARDADFAKGAELDPSNGRGLTAYAEYLHADDRPADAARVLQSALLIDPISPHAHFLEATRSLDVYGKDVLQQKMLEVLELDPNFVPALQRYGKYRWQHHAALAEAVQIEEHAIALDPANAWTRHTAMAMYLDLGDLDAARDVAAGTPESAAAAPMLVSLWNGDWRAAGLAAAMGRPGWQYGVFENWGAGQALRDFGINTGDVEDTVSFMKSEFNLQEKPPFGLGLANFQQAVFLSQLLAARGQGQEAVELRHAAEKWNDANQAKYGSLYAHRLRATTLLLDGAQDAALEELAESFRAGDYVLWWYTIKFDPLWKPLHNDPRFQAITADVGAYIVKQRAALELLRKQGVIPVRGRLAQTH